MSQNILLDFRDVLIGWFLYFIAFATGSFLDLKVKLKYCIMLHIATLLFISHFVTSIFVVYLYYNCIHRYSTNH